MSFSKKEMQNELLTFLTLFGQEIANLYGISDNSWTDPEAIKNTRMWIDMDEMYDYGVSGIPTGQLLPGHRFNGSYAHTELFIRSMNSLPMKIYLENLEASPPHLALLTIQSAIARIVLDGGNKYTDYASHKYGPGNGDWGYLTIADIAVLANMDERSVRNAANPKLPDHLITEQVGKRTLVRPEEARRWLSNRKGFVPTQETNLMLEPVPEWNIQISEDIFKKLKKEAKEAGISFEKNMLNKLLDLVKNEGK